MKYLKIPITFIYIIFLFERIKNIFFHAYYFHAFVCIYICQKILHANIFAILIIIYMILGTNVKTILQSEMNVFENFTIICYNYSYRM